MAIDSRGTPPLRIESGLIADVGADASGIRVFRGLPYAAPPVGARRWRAPQPVEPWAGFRNAERWGPRCMQGDRLGDLDPLNDRMSEDCLYLNVWTPAKSAADRLPVMVWIHGGSNNLGAASQPEYDGAHLAAKGVVVVTINYRLDVFGFLAHPDLTAESGTGASGNYGLLDQIAALRWTQDNISTFGGDPDCVTVFGESAGAFDVSLLMASPLTEGLFTRAIGASGGALSPSLIFGPKPLRIGEQEGLRFAQALGCERIADLCALPAEKVLAAALKSPISYAFGVVDGYVVPEHPAAIYAGGQQRAVPLLVGRNRDEGSLFAPRLATFGPGEPSYAERVRSQFADAADEALAHYPPGATLEADKAAYATLVGDQVIDLGAWRWAELAAASGRSPTYRYFFDRRPPGAPEASIYPLAAPGVFHFAEISYVFDNLQVRDWRWEREDRRLADAMSSYWVNFAKHGDPNGAGLPHWPPYRPGGAGQVMQLGREIGARADDAPERARLEFLNEYYRRAASR